MTYTLYSIISSSQSVTVDGSVASGVSMVGIPLNVSAIQWKGNILQGTVEYYVDSSGVLPPPTTFTDPAIYETYVTEALAIIEAFNNPVLYYFTEFTTFDGSPYPIGAPYTSFEVGHPAPANTVLTPPPAVASGQTLYWYDSAWVVSSFDPNLTLPGAKTSLISTVTQTGATAVNTELGLYSNVQQIEAGSVLALDTLTYPGTTIGEYQTYVDGLVASSTATINAAVSTTGLYTFNPAEVPIKPESSGIIFTGRGAGLGPLDMNVSYFVEWNSTTVTESDTELYIPGTATVIPYDSYAGGFDSMGNCFTLGNYTVQVRQASTGFVLAEYECPLAPAGVNVSF